MSRNATTLNCVTDTHIRRGIKKGFGMQEFCACYHCSEAELRSRIYTIYSSEASVKRGKADKVLSQIKNNDEINSRVEDRFKSTKEGEEIYEISKNNRRRKGNKPSAFNKETVVTPEPVPVAVPEPEPMVAPEPMAVPEPVPMAVSNDAEVPESAPTAVSDDVSEGSAASAQDKLATLRAEEDTISKEVQKLEIEHKEVARDHLVCIKKMRDLKTELDEIKASFTEKLGQYESLVNEHNTLAAKMNAISDKRSERLTKLDEIREEIEKLEKPIIYVFADGTIKAENESLELSDTGASELASKIFNDQSFDAYTAKDIKLAARIIATLANLDTEAELLIDDEGISEIVTRIIQNRMSVE